MFLVVLLSIMSVHINDFSSVTKFLPSDYEYRVKHVKSVINNEEQGRNVVGLKSGGVPIQERITG